MTATVKLTGARELRASLKRAGVGLDDLKDANARVAGYVAGIAAARAPRRTGRLAGSIRGNRAAGRARISAGGAAVPYAGPIHWGWPDRNITANPWISAAATDSELIWLDEYRRAVDKIIDKIGT